MYIWVLKIRSMEDMNMQRKEVEAEIRAAYEAGKLSAELEPYFRWKESGEWLTHQQVLTMQAQCLTEIEVIWEDENPDDLIASYYSYIEKELQGIDMMYRE